MNNLFWQFYVDKRTEHFYNTLDIQSIKQNGLWNKKKATVKKKTWMLRLNKLLKILKHRHLNRINWFPELYTHVQDKNFKTMARYHVKAIQQTQELGSKRLLDFQFDKVLKEHLTVRVYSLELITEEADQEPQKHKYLIFYFSLNVNLG